MKITNIRMLRIQNRWTLRYVGDKVGLSSQSVHSIETLKRKPSYDVILRLEELFCKPHGELLSLIKLPNP